MACRERGRSARGDSFIWTFESQQLAESQLQNREDYLFLWGPRSRTQPLGVLCSSAPPVPNPLGTVDFDHHHTAELDVQIPCCAAHASWPFLKKTY